MFFWGQMRTLDRRLGIFRSFLSDTDCRLGQRERERAGGLKALRAEERNEGDDTVPRKRAANCPTANSHCQLGILAFLADRCNRRGAVLGRPKERHVCFLTGRTGEWEWGQQQRQQYELAQNGKRMPILLTIFLSSAFTSGALALKILLDVPDGQSLQGGAV